MSRRPNSRALLLLTIANLAVVILVRCWITRSGGWLAYSVSCLPHLVGLPTAAILAASLYRRDLRAALINCAAAAIFLTALMGFNIPWHHWRRCSGQSVRIMTYNVAQGAGGATAIASVISSAGPQIVCLQEVRDDAKRGDPLAALIRGLPGEWYAARHEDLAVLSRFPFRRVTRHAMPLRPGRGIIVATVRVGGNVLSVVNTHPSGAAAQRATSGGRLRRLARRMGATSRVISAQAEGTVAVARKAPGSAVVVGDFNMPRLSPAYRRISAGYRDAFRAAGWGFGYTYRSNRPFQRIDYVFVGNGIGVRDCRVIGSRASDHRPVVADLVLKP